MKKTKTIFIACVLATFLMACASNAATPGANSDASAPVAGSPVETAAPASQDSIPSGVIPPTINPLIGERSILETLMTDGRFTTLIDLVDQAELVTQLKNATGITVFAPTDQAFAALPPGTLDNLKLEENKGQLGNILSYHVIPSPMSSLDLKLMSGQPLSTSLAGQSLNISADGSGVIYLNNSAKIVNSDITASNGIIHVIDVVLMPNG